MRRVLSALLACAAAATARAGFELPRGFEIREFAGNGLATDIQCVALDPKGRVVVAGRGYIRILVDDDGDGVADRAIPFAEGPNVTAMGLFWEKDHLYFTGDGGLRRFHTKDGDHADGPSQLIRAVKASGEHDAHAIRRGPDGWLYLLCGNSSGIDRKWCGPRSPITDPVAGCVVRFSPDFSTTEVVADGYRNPYDFDFNIDGELFTYDSDNERCVSLPWYEGCRFYHVLPGGNYGWRSPQLGEFWRTPPYFYDCVPPIADLGRGSPTGVVCYRHRQFPEKYRGAFFLLDWTFGKIYCLKPHPKGATYEGDAEVFLRPTGDDGFAPVGAAVQPSTGDLFVAIGGRGTRGAVYRIRYAEGFKAAAASPSLTSIHSTSLDKAPDWALVADVAKKGTPPQRRRAVESFARWADEAPSDPALEAAMANWGSPDRAMRQAVTRYFIRQPEVARWAANQLKANLAGNTATLSGRETRFATITWIASQGGFDPRVLGANWFQRTAFPEWRGGLEGGGLGAGLASTDADEVCLVDLLSVVGRVHGLGSGKPSRGTMTEGYSFRSALDYSLAHQLLRVCASGRPTKESLRERLRILPLFALPSNPLNDRLERALHLSAVRLATSQIAADSPIDVVHALICLSQLELSNIPIGPVANALVNLDEKLDARGMARDRNWPLRLRELHEALAKKLPSLNKAILDSPAFGRPDHTLFALAPSFAPLRAKAAEKFLAWLEKRPDQLWTGDHVRVIAALPRQKSFPLLRKHWDELGLRDDILAAMAAAPGAEDRARLFEGLSSPQLNTLRQCLGAIGTLIAENGTPPGRMGGEVRELLAAFDQAPQGKEGEPLRKQILAVVEAAAGEKETHRDRAAWGRWLGEKFPAEAAKLTATGVDWPKWEKRLQTVDWNVADVARGKMLFTKQACAACHAGGRALGPDLRGAANRFARRDLFIAICDPSRDVPVRYRTTLVATKGGKTYQGMVIYEAADGVMLQIGADQTVRIAAADIESRQLQRKSLMPPGLLDPLTDKDVADLYGYLKSLK